MPASTPAFSSPSKELATCGRRTESLLVVFQGAGTGQPTLTYSSHPGVTVARTGTGQYQVELPVCALAVPAGFSLLDSGAFSATGVTALQFASCSGPNGVSIIRVLETDAAPSMIDAPSTVQITLEYRLIAPF